MNRGEIRELLATARARAYPPISEFRVGAVVLGASGRYYLGGNIEIPRVGLGQTVHAEQAALANAYMGGESAVVAIAVTAAPCGHCRQFLQEFSPDGSLQVFIGGARPVRLSTLLPKAFGPSDLGQKRGALPAVVQRFKLAKRDGLAQAALDAACRSYAPYSSAHSGVAIQSSDRRVFTGSYIENAAFNPSLPPLQSALSALVAAGADPGTIKRAALVEVGGTRITQRNAAAEALSMLAPSARLTVSIVWEKG